MHPIKSIRKEILNLNVTQFAEVAGVSQGTVSKWENGHLVPDLAEMHRIRDYAQSKGIPWNDAWFFHPAVTPQPIAV